MIFLPFLHFFCFICSVFLAVFILYKDSKHLLNRLVAVTMSCYALWNLGDVVLHNPDPAIRENSVIIMQNIASVGWISFAGALFCFSLVFTANGKLLKKKWLLFLVFVPPVIFLYQQLTQNLTVNPTRQYYGWSVSWADNIWTYLFYSYYLFFTLISLTIIYLYHRKTEIIFIKKQAKVIIVTICICVLAGTFMDVIVQEAGFINIPPITNLLVAVFAGGVIYAMSKYRFLTISPAIAADKIVSAMDELLILLNRDGSILNVNKATLETLKFDEKELSGKDLSVLFSEEDDFRCLAEKISREEAVKNCDSSFRSKDGVIVPVIFSSSPLRDNTGQTIGTVFIARDITQHKLIEDELVRAKEKAEQSDNFKSAFLANMSHEIRTPMNGILGFADLLKDPGLSGEKQLEYLQIIEKSGMRMLNIINDIIDISKIEAGLIEVVLKETNINEQLEYMYTFFRPEVESMGMQLSFRKGLPSKEAVISTDREKVYAILMNLIKNAIKYSGKGSIEFGYDIIAENGRKHLKFLVKDTGRGIPREKQEEIFERFIQLDFSTKGMTQGAGLGLSITKAYVELLGGRIWVESEPGAGSVFYFTLPYNTSEKEKYSVPGEKDETENQVLEPNLTRF